jgi:16S rRNA (cytosine967-C5)-methyltransferase
MSMGRRNLRDQAAAAPVRSRERRWAPGAMPLADAAAVVCKVVFGGHSADFGTLERSSRGAVVRAIALGSIRWYLRLAPAIERLLTHPQAVQNEVRALLVTSAHQLEYSRNPVHATVLAAVDAARILKCPGAAGLVNAVLRRFVKEREPLLAETDKGLAQRTAHPAWLVDALARAWPEQCEQILAANNEHPPMVLRVDLTRRTRAAYVAELEAAGVSARAVAWAEAAVQLEKPAPVSDLPGFWKTEAASGPVAAVTSVQDAGAQLAPLLLGALPGMRVLDACAAPGGKTGHLLEHTPGLRLLAIDIDADRVLRIRDNLVRLQREAHVVVGDVREPTTFWDGVPFDRILVDAPCSSTGVIRRHPDIKLLRRRDDVTAFAATQLEILRAAFRMLAPGGRVLYSTCSVLPEENEDVIGRLLDSEPFARPGPMPPAAQLAPEALDRRRVVQLLPGSEAGTDGFYYACVEKTTAGT